MKNAKNRLEKRSGAEQRLTIVRSGSAMKNAENRVKRK
jgi:hypothetical protein